MPNITRDLFDKILLSYAEGLKIYERYNLVLFKII